MSKYLFERGFVALGALTVVFGCATTRYVPEDRLLLRSAEVKSDNKSFDTSLLVPYIRQHTNSRWFSMFKVPLGIYNMSGKDSTRWGNRLLRRFGEPPVIYDSLATELTCLDMNEAMWSMGYLNAKTICSTIVRQKKAYVTYTVSPGDLYTIDSITYVFEDENVAKLLHSCEFKWHGLETGMAFSTVNLDAERKRITKCLTESGFYKFNKDFIHYEADSIGKDGKVDVTLRLTKYRASNNSKSAEHKPYTINKITYNNGNRHMPIREKVLEKNTFIKTGKPFSTADVQQTYNNFSKLQAVKFTNIHFEEVADTSLLNCNIHIGTRKPNTISFQPEGTNTAGDFGAGASVTYENNNIFRGSELLSVQLRGAFEAITGLDGYQNQNYNEYNIETRLEFPRLIVPFMSHKIKRVGGMRSELLFSYNMQNRPEFHRRVLSSSWRYHWNADKGLSNYRLDFIDINYVHMPWISSTFKKDYLDDASNRNAILRYNYEDLFILRTGINYSYNNGRHAIKTNFELGGNLLSGLSRLLNLQKNDRGQYTLFNIAFAQYVKGDFDYTHVVNLDAKNTLALHCGIGLAYPYGNSKVLPFEKRYFSGGANSVRGWNVRELGPGRFKGSDGKIDFINQTGDMKLDLNMELRTYLFWKLNGAVFVDAGNIWTLKDYKDQPGGKFMFDEFYKQLAVGYGVGLRLNFDYFILRIDAGMKAVNPSYSTKREHYPLFNPSLKRDCSLHFAVGMPF